jgi:hypothetical protein
MLHTANTFVADGERHLYAQEGLMVEQKRTGRQRAESAKLLSNMYETQCLMMAHVRLFESELQEDGEAPPPREEIRALSKMRCLTEREADLVASSLRNLAESRELLERVTAVHAVSNAAVQSPLIVRPFRATDGQGRDT